MSEAAVSSEVRPLTFCDGVGNCGEGNENSHAGGLNEYVNNVAQWRPKQTDMSLLQELTQRG